MKTSNMIAFLRATVKDKGVFYTVYATIRAPLGLFYYKFFKPSKTFLFRSKKYKLFYHLYNNTWRNERSVEIPIIIKILNDYKNKKILEFGNVISNYISTKHDILDKYEKVKGVINKDIIDFTPNKKYDLIVSISTLEHVGWDEKPKDPKKILHAIKKLRSFLSEKGEMIVTMPIGYNCNLDKLFKNKEIPFNKFYCLKKIEKSKWIEVSPEEIENSKYGKPFYGANGLIIGVFDQIK